MSDQSSRAFGPYPYNHKTEDVFLDAARGTINFEYFRPYFDAVALPIEVAKASIGDHYSQFRTPIHVEFVKFVKLSTLRTKDRIPAHEEIKADLVDFRDIASFELVGQLKAFGGDDVFSKTPCVFVSHRWQSVAHPDPDGSRLRQIIERFDASAPPGSHVADDEIYLWIDFCCLPQRACGPLSQVDHDCLQVGLARLAEIVKSCDLLVLDSPDYIGRAWCYAEICVWLTKLAEVGHGGRYGIFQSVLTRHLLTERLTTSNAHGFDQSVVENVQCRGYGGSAADLLAVYRPVSDYRQTTIDSANYNLGAFEHEYVPTLIGFMCNTWHTLQGKQCTDRSDMEVCLRVIVQAVKFVGAA